MKFIRDDYEKQKLKYMKAEFEKLSSQSSFVLLENGEYIRMPKNFNYKIQGGVCYTPDVFLFDHPKLVKTIYSLKEIKRKIVFCIKYQIFNFKWLLSLPKIKQLGFVKTYNPYNKLIFNKKTGQYEPYMYCGNKYVYKNDKFNLCITKGGGGFFHIEKINQTETYPYPYHLFISSPNFKTALKELSNIYGIHCVIV